MGYRKIQQAQTTYISRDFNLSLGAWFLMKHLNLSAGGKLGISSWVCRFDRLCCCNRKALIYEYFKAHSMSGLNSTHPTLRFPSLLSCSLKFQLYSTLYSILCASLTNRFFPQYCQPMFNRRHFGVSDRLASRPRILTLGLVLASGLKSRRSFFRVSFPSNYQSNHCYESC